MLKFDKISYWRILLSGVLYAIVAQVIHTIGAMLAMSYYTMEEYLPVWSKIMMPTAGPPPISFMVYGIVYAFITGLLFTGLYIHLGKALPYKSVVKKGLSYGLAVFCLAGIPGALSMHLLFNLPLVLIISWTIEGLVIYLLNGMIVAKLAR
jgi:hypothetical protein